MSGRNPHCQFGPEKVHNAHGEILPDLSLPNMLSVTSFDSTACVMKCCKDMYSKLETQTSMELECNHNFENAMFMFLRNDRIKLYKCCQM